MNLVHIRELYIKVICNTIAYEVSAWYIPIKEGQPKGLTKALFTIQSEYLRIVTGIYRTTPIYCLEREVDVPSIDIYLNKRIADFERRLVESGITKLISNSNTAIATYLYNRHPYRYPKKVYPKAGPAKVEWTNKWLESDSSEDTVCKDWEKRWRRYARTADTRYRPCISELAERKPDFDKDILEKHRNLLKYENSVLIQIRIGKIGLKAFLHKRDISDMETLFCNCSQMPETAVHLAIECQETIKERQRLSIEITASIYIRYNFDLALKDPLIAGKVTKWILKLGYLY